MWGEMVLGIDKGDLGGSMENILMGVGEMRMR